MAKQKSIAIRESILESATSVFAKTGFYKAKAIEIARKADIAVGTIYNYFKNKDDILISIFNERIGGLNRSLEKRLQEIDNPDDTLFDPFCGCACGARNRFLMTRHLVHRDKITSAPALR